MAHLLAVVSVIIWGVTFISTKILLEDFNAVEIMFGRFFLGWAALCVIGAKNLLKTLRLPLRQEILFAGAGLTGVTLYFFFENVALSYTYASNVSMIVSASPVFVALAAHFWVRGERIGSAFFAGFTAAMLGIGLIAYSGSALLMLNPLGDGLALVAAVVWGLYSVLLKKISLLGLEIIAATRKTFFWGLLFLIPLLFFEGRPSAFGTLLNAQALMHFAFLGLGASALCYVAWTYAVDKLGATRASAYIYLIPPVTAAASYVFLQERITLPAALGCVLVLSGLYLSERASHKRG